MYNEFVVTEAEIAFATSKYSLFKDPDFTKQISELKKVFLAEVQAD
jgi:hypothetical protein